MDEKAINEKAYEKLIIKLEGKGFSVIADDNEITSVKLQAPLKN